MSIYIVYHSCGENGHAYGDVRWGAYLSLDSARSAVRDHYDNRYEFYPDGYFYEEYQLDICEPEDNEVNRVKLFES
jgi:hypothetical protein